MTMNNMFLTLCAFLTMAFMLQLCDCSFLQQLESQNMNYDCYTDICTVGIQFCSREDQACVPCNEDVCNEPDSPSMCKAFCKYKDEENVPVKPTAESTIQTPPSPGVTEPLIEIQPPSCCLLSTKSEELVLVLFGYGLALGFLVIFTFLAYHFHQRSRKSNLDTEAVPKMEKCSEAIPESNNNGSYTETVTSRTQPKVVKDIT